MIKIDSVKRLNRKRCDAKRPIHMGNNAHNAFNSIFDEFKKQQNQTATITTSTTTDTVIMTANPIHWTPCFVFCASFSSIPLSKDDEHIIACFKLIIDET